MKKTEQSWHQREFPSLSRTDFKERPGDHRLHKIRSSRIKNRAEHQPDLDQEVRVGRDDEGSSSEEGWTWRKKVGGILLPTNKRGQPPEKWGPRHHKPGSSNVVARCERAYVGTRWNPHCPNVVRVHTVFHVGPTWNHLWRVVAKCSI